VIHFHGKKNVSPTSMTSTHSLPLQQKQVEGIMEEYRDIFSSPTRLSMHFQVNHPIHLTPITPLPNGPIYRRSLMENNEVKHHIQEIIQKGHIRPKSPLVEDRLYWCRRNTGPGDFALITGP
jgi:hypothetical protein